MGVPRPNSTSDGFENWLAFDDICLDCCTGGGFGGECSTCLCKDIKSFEDFMTCKNMDEGIPGKER